MGSQLLDVSDNTSWNLPAFCPAHGTAPPTSTTVNATKSAVTQGSKAESKTAAVQRKMLAASGTHRKGLDTQEEHTTESVVRALAQKRKASDPINKPEAPGMTA